MMLFKYRFALMRSAINQRNTFCRRMQRYDSPVTFAYTDLTCARSQIMYTTIKVFYVISWIVFLHLEKISSVKVQLLWNEPSQLNLNMTIIESAILLLRHFWSNRRIEHTSSTRRRVLVLADQSPCKLFTTEQSQNYHHIRRSYMV